MDKSNVILIALIWSAIAVVSFPFLMKIKAPYGRHTRNDFGPLISNRLGWIIMELPSLLLFLFLSQTGSSEKTSFFYIICAVYIAHYINRSIIYPLRTKTKNKKIPLSIVGSAIFFNFMNGGLNGYFMGNFYTDNQAWVFGIGLLICVFGIYINLRSDEILLSLRKDKEDGYKIPKGFLYEKITSPNYFGEIIEWTGWAIMAGNPAAWSFVLWTMANLIPRAKDHHQWYKDKFSDYPKDRKIILPNIY